MHKHSMKTLVPWLNRKGMWKFHLLIELEGWPSFHESVGVACDTILLLNRVFS